jgi:hypothetical protein
MCNSYPNCSHLGKVVEKQGNLERNCETNKVNSTCRYLQLGCKGCTFKYRINLRRIASYMRLNNA